MLQTIFLPFPLPPPLPMESTSASDATRPKQKHSPSGRSTSTARAATTRGTTACAECRRLKIRCVGGWPCDSCVRRKCSSICPTGALQTGERPLAPNFLKHSHYSVAYNAKFQRHAFSVIQLRCYLMLVQGQGRCLIASMH